MRAYGMAPFVGEDESHGEIPVAIDDQDRQPITGKNPTLSITAGIKTETQSCRYKENHILGKTHGKHWRGSDQLEMAYRRTFAKYLCSK